MTNPTSHHDAHDRPHENPSARLLPTPGSRFCPSWCTTQHAVHAGEEDWLHTGEPVIVADGLAARLYMSIDPVTGDDDGPYVLIGSSEFTLAETARLGASLMDMGNAS